MAPTLRRTLITVDLPLCSLSSWDRLSAAAARLRGLVFSLLALSTFSALSVVIDIPALSTTSSSTITVNHLLRFLSPHGDQLCASSLFFPPLFFVALLSHHFFSLPHTHYTNPLNLLFFFSLSSKRESLSIHVLISSLLSPSPLSRTHDALLLRVDPLPENRLVTSSVVTLLTTTTSNYNLKSRFPPKFNRFSLFSPLFHFVSWSKKNDKEKKVHLLYTHIPTPDSR